MNQLLQDFEEAINAVLNDPRFDNIEAAQLVGVLHIKASCICSRLQKMGQTEDECSPDNPMKKLRSEDDPADYWKEL